MPTFERGDVVRVPFPYTDLDKRQYRPALVVSRGPLGDDSSLVWVVMITSAENRGWPGDVPFGRHHVASGLPAPSTIRTAKIATIEARHAALLGRVSAPLWARVAAAIRAHMGFGPV